MKSYRQKTQLYGYLKTHEIDHKSYLARFEWAKKARQDQRLPSGDWRVWLILAGRGFGKTRTGAETIRDLVAHSQYQRIGIIGATEFDTRSVMLEGQSGLLSCYPESEKPVYEPSKRLITWSNGATARLFSAEKPNQLRGPQFDFVWLDELCKFEKADALWDQINFSLRIGQNPRALVTTTPKPMPLLNSFITDPAVHVTRGSTFDNAQNLSPSFLTAVKTKYEGTTLGRQELYGDIVDIGDGGLWSARLVQTAKLQPHETLKLVNTIIAVDPAVTNTVHSDETGIIILGICQNQKAYVLDDLSGRFAPNQWIKIISEAYANYKASYVLLESNQGGDVLKSLLTTIDSTIRVKSVRATKNKYMRAEPVHALYEQGRVKHVNSLNLKCLEDQMLMFSKELIESQNASPDRVDALVWGVSELLLKDTRASKHNIVS